MVMADDFRPESDLTSREPTVEDLRNLCRELNERGAHYIVVGGFAIRAAGYNRGTMDIDLVVASDRDNEERVFGALSTLPDNAVRELRPGELEQYTVIRIADEILVDLMVRASGIDFSEYRWCQDSVCIPSTALAHETGYPSGERRCRLVVFARMVRPTR
jgi:hypothetical protein